MSPIQTRSQRRTAELVSYTTLEGNSGERSDRIQVISRNKLKANPDQHRLLKEKFDKISKSGSTTDGKNASSAKNLGKGVALVIHINVFLYAACFFIQIGTLPYLSKKLGADPETFGQLQTAFAIAQLCGGPLYGRVGDLLGERLALCIAFASATFSYLLMGLSYDLTILFLSRIPSVLMHAVQGAQMIITKMSSEEDRATALSRIGFSYGIGMVVGPTVGGFVNKRFGEQEAALVAAFGSLLSLAMIFFLVPNVSKEDKEKETQSDNVMDIGEIFKLIFMPGVSSILIIKLLCGIPIGVLQSMFSVIAMDKFGMGAEENGMMMSYIGVISLFMQGIGITLCSKLLSDKPLMLLSTVLLAITYYIMGILTDSLSFIILLFPLTCGLCIVNSILTSAATKSVPQDKTGTMLGLNMAVHSSIRSLAPTMGGSLIKHYGFEALGALGVGCNVLVITMLLLNQAKFA